MIIYAGGDRRARARHQGILLTDLSVSVAAFDNCAASILAAIQTENGRGPELAPLPAELVSVLINRPAAELDNRRITFRTASGECICRVSVLHPYNSRVGQPMLALHLYQSTDLNDEIEEFAAEHELTPRERQTLLGIANGLTCKEIAGELDLSPNTVKSFLRLLMVKIGVARRGEIISKVLDHQRYRL